MKQAIQSETIRVSVTTAKALRAIAYGPPFYCASIAEFLRLIERGDREAWDTWVVKSREYRY